MKISYPEVQRVKILLLKGFLDNRPIHTRRLNMFINQVLLFHASLVAASDKNVSCVVGADVWPTAACTDNTN